MKISYDGRIFRSLSNSDGGDVSSETTFVYHQENEIVWATYQGGGILFGTLIASTEDSGSLNMRYQHIASDGVFRSGRCHSEPELLPDGRLRLHEQWQWTEGADGEGRSVIEETRV